MRILHAFDVVCKAQWSTGFCYWDHKKVAFHDFVAMSAILDTFTYLQAEFEVAKQIIIESWVVEKLGMQCLGCQSCSGEPWGRGEVSPKLIHKGINDLIPRTGGIADNQVIIVWQRPKGKNLGRA